MGVPCRVSYQSVWFLISRNKIANSSTTVAPMPIMEVYIVAKRRLGTCEILRPLVDSFLNEKRIYAWLPLFRRSAHRKALSGAIFVPITTISIPTNADTMGAA